MRTRNSACESERNPVHYPNKWNPKLAKHLWIVIPVSVMCGDMVVLWQGLPPRIDSPFGLMMSIAISGAFWWSLFSLAGSIRVVRWGCYGFAPLVGLLIGGAWQTAAFTAFPDSAILLYVAKEPQSAWNMASEHTIGWLPFAGLLLGIAWAFLFSKSQKVELKNWIFVVVAVAVAVGSMLIPEPQPYRGAPYISDVRLANGTGVAIQRYIMRESVLPHVTKRRPVTGDFEQEIQHDVLIVLTESLRADHLPMYGYRTRDTMPALTRLSEEVNPTVFERAFSDSAYTVLSLSTVLTGLSISEPEEKLSDVPLLWNYARHAGLKTFYFSAQDLRWGHVTEFLLLHEPPDVLYSAYESDEPVVNEVGIDDRHIARRAAAEIESLGADERFFGIVQTNATHFPFFNPEPKPWVTNDVPSRYDASIRVTDDAFAIVVDALRSTNRLRSTMIVFVSDHGEYIYRESDKNHAAAKQGRLRVTSCHPTITRIPFVLFTPDHLRTPMLAENQKTIVSTLDIVPTVLASWGFPTEQFKGYDLRGQIPNDRIGSCFSPNFARIGDLLGFATYGPESAYYARTDFARAERFDMQNLSQYDDWSSGEPFRNGDLDALEEIADKHETMSELLQRMRDP